MPTTDTEFEKAFADLAFGSLRDKAPSLFDYLVGFQVLDTNDDQTHALGVFGCHVQDDWVYLPVFFHNGELKGQELAYLKNQDMFIPLQENWVSYILSRRPLELGDTSSLTRRQVNVTPPDFSSFIQSPVSWNKTAKANTWKSSNIQPWAQPFVEAAKKSLNVALGLDEASKQAFARLDLRSFIRDTGPVGADAVYTLMQTKAASFGEAVLQFYTIDDLKPPVFGLSAQMLSAKIAASKAPYSEHKHTVESSGLQALPWAPPEEKQQVFVITRNNVNASHSSDLSDADLERLYRGEVLVKDNRTNKNKLYAATTSQAVTTPSSTGVYRMYSKASGELRDVAIIASPLPLGLGRVPTAVAVDLDTKTAVNIAHSRLFVAVDRTLPADWVRFVDSCAAVSEMEEGSSYVLVTPAGTGTIPFTVLKKSKNDTGLKELWVSADTEVHSRGCDRPYGRSVTQSIQLTGSNPGRWNKDTTEGRHLILTGREGQLANVGNTLYVPSNARVIKVSGDNYKFPTPGNTEDVQIALLTSNAFKGVKVSNRGSGEYEARVGEKSSGVTGYAETLEFLLTTANIGEADAVALIKQASVREAARAYVKTAFSPTGDEGPSAPTLQDPTMGSDAVTGAAVQTPDTRALAVPDNAASRYDSRNLMSVDPRKRESLPFENPTALAEQAARTGQKEIFDPGVIGSLLKVVDSDSLVDKYLGDLMRGLDRIGRILFLYYQHTEAFMERYGDTSQTELEDSLRNSFKSIGDLILFLRQRATEETPETRKTEVDLGPLAG